MLERLISREITNTAASGPGEVLHVLPELGIDLELRSTLDLRKVGVHRYAADASTSVLCAAFAVADAPPELWIPGTPCPETIKRAVSEGWIIHAFNANFELTIWHHILAPRHGWPEPKLDRWRCTQAMALALSLPAKLENVAHALELRHQKDAVGHRLMLMMARPRKAHKDEDPTRTYWFEDPDRLGRLYEYCEQDVKAERELFGRCQPLSPSEQALWTLDATINQRGFPHRSRAGGSGSQDCPGCGAGDRCRACRSHRRCSHGHQSSRQMQVWLGQNGCAVKDLQQKTVAKLLEVRIATESAARARAPPGRWSGRC